MRTLRIVSVLIPLLFAVSVPASAQTVVAGFGQTKGAGPVPPGPGGHFFFLSTRGGFPPFPLPIIPPVMMGLPAAHLTAAQRKKMGGIMMSNRLRIAPLIRQLQSVHRQIADKLLAPGTVTASDLAPLEKQAARLDAKIQHQTLEASVKIRSLLTPAQISRMAQFHQKMAALQKQMSDLIREASQSRPHHKAL